MKVRSVQSIVLVMDSLATGGAEIVAVKLANALVQHGRKVTLVLMSRHDACAYLLHPSVRVVHLNAQRRFIGSVLSVIKLRRFLRRENPDACISGIETLHALVWLASCLSGRQMMVLGIIHTMLSKHWKMLSCLRLALWREGMRRIKLVAVADAAARDAEMFLRLPAGAIQTIYNPVVDDALFAAAEQARSGSMRSIVPTLICVGGLKPMKRFDLAIRAFAAVRDRRVCRMVIVGEGPERASLEALIAQLGLSADVMLLGHQDNPAEHMLHAHCFLLSSDYEGLPSVLIEALACGCAVVATDCISGPAEILEQGRYGTLVSVGDSDAMASAVATAFAYPPNVQKREEAIRRAHDFSAYRAAQHYLQALEGVGV